jgi:hypothetical protein
MWHSGHQEYGKCLAKVQTLRRGGFDLGRIPACPHTVNPPLAVGQLRD